MEKKEFIMVSSIFLIVIIFLIFILIFVIINKPTDLDYNIVPNELKKYLDFCDEGNCGTGTECDSASLRCKYSENNICNSGSDCANNMSCNNNICEK